MEDTKPKSNKMKKFIIEFIVTLAFIGLLVIVYFVVCTPDIISDFKKYDGLNFDYKLEEENYANKLYYKQLSESEAKHYRAMYHASINDEAKYYLESMDLFVAEEAEKASEAFSFDFPEYYWFGQVLNADNTSIKDKINLFDSWYVTVSVECFGFKEEDIVPNREKIDAKLDEILPGLKGDNDIDTIRNIFDYMVVNTSYDNYLYETSDIRAALLYGRGTVETYAETFQFLANKLGYECYTVPGECSYVYNGKAIGDRTDVTAGESFIWEFNLINLNDSWYWIDTSWADGDSEYEDFSKNKQPLIDYAYLFVPDDVFFIDHKLNDNYVYPECNNSDIYLVNAIVLDSYDEKVIDDCLAKAFKEEKTEYTFHFNSTEDVDKLLEYYNKNKVYKVYQKNIHKYIEGRCRWVVSNNCAVYFEWKIKNLY